MMRLNEYMGATIVGRTDHAVTLAVDIDWDRLREAFKGMAKATNKAARQFGKTIKQMGVVLHRAANDEVRVAGLEGRYYVRGGLLCPDIGALVRALMTDPASVAPEDEDLLMDLLTPASRARLAAKAIEGHVTHTPGEPGPGLPWHRYMSGIRLEVS